MEKNLMDINKLRTNLETSIVLITFQSLKSGSMYNREYTLCEKYMKVPNHVLNQQGDKLICYDVEFQKWEDIEIDSIESFIVVE